MSYVYTDDIAVAVAPLDTAEKFYSRFGKRALDVAVVILISPVIVAMVLLICCICWLGGGPGFYSQARVGRGGDKFNCWKIRTMQKDADKVLQAYINSDPDVALEWQSKQKLDHDPRITKFGHFLRKTSLDELPQFWNVLIGDMSLIGPRPFTPDQQALYDGDKRRPAYYSLRPGISGLWQVKSRNTGAFRVRVAFDETYARDMTFRNDLTIAAQTIWVVLRATGQ